MDEMTIKLTPEERILCLSALIKTQNWWHKISGMPWPLGPSGRDAVVTLMEKLGLPNSEEMVIVCRVCGHPQTIKVSDYALYLTFDGHPYTCRDHSYLEMLPISMIPDKKEGEEDAET